jgi:hypothetical protein
MIENLLLDECVFGKTLHNQEERRRGISLQESNNHYSFIYLLLGLIWGMENTEH